MRLDTTNFSFLSKDDWKILHAIENESKTHEIVPIDLLGRYAKMDPIAIDQACGLLTRYKLIRRQGTCQVSQSNTTKFTGSSIQFDQEGNESFAHRKRRGHKGAPLGTLGYTLGFGGLDFLALNFFQQKGSITSLSMARLGVGKEADVHKGERQIADGSIQSIIVKFHRLGRTSFRSVRTKRDYHLRKGSNANSWMHLSVIAASIEWEFLKVFKSFLKFSRCLMLDFLFLFRLITIDMQ